MVWNWEHKDWPNFQWNDDQLVKYESEFFINAGELAGLFKHLSTEDKKIR